MRSFAQQQIRPQPSAFSHLTRPPKTTPSTQPHRGAIEQLQAKRIHEDDFGPIAIPVVHGVLQSSGQPLDMTTRNFMEWRFGHDFGDVRVHTDALAAEAASAIDARAFTAGRDIVFGPGEYVPQTEPGRQLLSHELTHVVQQRARVQLNTGIEEPDSPAEVAANEVSRRILHGQPVSISGNGSSAISRKERGDEEPTAELESKEHSGAGSDINPYEERRYQGAVYKLSEKFGSDFIVYFTTSHLGGFGKTINADAKGQIDLTNKIGEFNFQSLQNRSDDPYPATLDLQSVMSWRVDSKGKYVKKSWQKKNFAPEPAAKITMVDNPGFRGGGLASVDLVMDLATTAGANIRFIVRLMIIEEKPVV